MGIPENRRCVLKRKSRFFRGGNKEKPPLCERMCERKGGGWRFSTRTRGAHKKKKKMGGGFFFRDPKKKRGRGLVCTRLGGRQKKIRTGKKWYRLWAVRFSFILYSAPRKFPPTKQRGKTRFFRAKYIYRSSKKINRFFCQRLYPEYYTHKLGFPPPYRATLHV